MWHLNSFLGALRRKRSSVHQSGGRPGRSFYESLFPPDFLSLGWSSIAVHWLSDVPQPIPGHIYCSFAEGEARDALRARSAADWRNFLAARALELRQ